MRVHHLIQALGDLDQHALVMMSGPHDSGDQYVDYVMPDEEALNAERVALDVKNVNNDKGGWDTVLSIRKPYV